MLKVDERPNLLQLTGRTKNKFIQLALDSKNLTDKQKEKIKFPLLSSVKVDGVFCIAWKHEADKVTIYSRTGEIYSSMKHLENAIAEVLPKNALLIFEAYATGQEQATISGWARDTKQQHPQLKGFCHDVLTLKEFLGECGSFYESRYAHLIKLLPVGSSLLPRAVQLLHYDWNSVYQKAEEVWAGGGEGLILRNPAAPYEPGKRNSNILKIKERISYDFLCVGIEEGEGKFKGMVGALQFRFKEGQTVSVGTGMLEEERKYWFANPQGVIGKICEIAAMKESSKGVLREPAFKGIRHDKTEGDF